MSNDDLNKSLKELLTSALISYSGAQPKNELNLNGLHKELIPIAYLESSGGKNTKHEKNSKGPLHTAIGSLGLKPITAHEEYLKSPHLQKLYPNLDNVEDFAVSLQNNPNLYNHVASSHWNRLKSSFGNTNKAAFAWRYGAGAASKVAPEVIANDKYIKSYGLISKKLHAGQNPLSKSIADLKPGKRTKTYTIKKDGSVPDLKVRNFNYDHLLSPEHIKEGYSLSVTQQGDDALVAKISHNGLRVGDLGSKKLPSPILANRLKINDALLRNGHRGKGLGASMYEAVFAHAKHKMGVDTIHGDAHSTMASKVHSRLAKKHGLNYQPRPNYGPGADFETKKDWEAVKDGPFDSKLAPYEYQLSEENMDKALRDIPVPKEGQDEMGRVGTFDYSHLLSPQERESGLRIHVRRVNKNGRQDWVSELNQLDPATKRLSRKGVVEGTPEMDNLRIDYARLEGNKGDEPNSDEEFRGKGYGTKLYEALMAHGKNHLKLKNVIGSEHSSMAHSVHKKLAAKHGMDYRAELAPPPVLRPTEKPADPSIRAMDGKFGPYSYELKSEEPMSKAIADIKPGIKDDNDIYDYTHVLPEAYQKKGYRMELHDFGDDSEVHISHPEENESIGVGTFSFRDNAVTPDISGVKKIHRGQGLGVALYEAAFAHAFHNKGIREVKGNEHSTSASRTHRRLSEKHGLKYTATPNSAPLHPAGADHDGQFDKYNYPLSSET